MSEKTFYPIVQRRDGRLYKFLGGDQYENVMTGVTGEIAADVAAKNLVFCMFESQMVHDYPLVLDLIRQLNLKIR